MFLGWFDDDRKKRPEQKIAEGVERFKEKFGYMPSICLVNEADAGCVVDGIEVVVKPFIRKSHYWIGDEGGK